MEGHVRITVRIVGGVCASFVCPASSQNLTVRCETVAEIGSGGHDDVLFEASL